MVGTIKINIVAGMSTGGIIFLLSSTHNPIFTSLIRGIECFVFIFLFTYFIRWLLALTFRPDGQSSPEDDNKGNHIDLSTPAEDYAEDVPQQVEQSDDAADNDFSPLNPPKLASREKPETEDVVNAIRHMSEQ